ncbi:HPr kinase/phosphatase C-terminal domain-containing protein [Sphingomonas sp. KR1UV-12]|uniref:HPr kinase/phosphatase C-terminal domain-containing protein n=1 Tax=Sphingomonas aurea TaxID=3063994 RepID=A0ABT9EHL5_9SPHN|nr:HPr kinase/phosphatase C-terminal domain-containing protein [Sphingomonas sp. KR1UV-12]MDP1026332.1 HPr kinase/phosphatase C-terminal domain-containing protein [Sphingomonas sp. KR1UV-12]
MPRLHATTIAIDGQGVLIEGPSGAGKSDLALRLIDRGAQLVSDDYTEVQRSGDALVATAPATIMGRMEVRGIGIVDMLGAGPTPVALIVELSGEVPRLPEPRYRDIDGVTIAAVTLDAFTASAPIKVELALRRGLPA